MEISKIFREKITVKRIFQFLREIYYSDKIIELFSFVIWEIKYKLNLFPEDKVVIFSDTYPLSILTRSSKQIKIKSDGFEISQSLINWSFVFIDKSHQYWGKKYDDESTLYQFTTEGALISSFKFKGEILGLYINKANDIFCCSNGILYKSSEDKKTFTEVLKFSTPLSYFLADAFTETPTGELFIGEYGNVFENSKWKFLGNIYYSSDNGNNWEKIDFLKNAGVNKHIHLLKWSNVINGLILTDGDNKKNIWMNFSKTQFDKPSISANSGWKRLNRYHYQKGGHTGFAELNDKILFGSDYNGGTNFLITTKDMLEFDVKVVPNPYRRAFFTRIAVRINEKSEYELWAVNQFEHSVKDRSLVMMSNDYGKTWKRVIEYDGTQFQIVMISNSREIAKELYILIIDKTENTATTLHIH